MEGRGTCSFHGSAKAEIERSEIMETTSVKNTCVFDDGILKIEQRKKENAKVKFKQIFFVARRKLQFS